jgi:hypothetical protein
VCVCLCVVAALLWSITVLHGIYVMEELIVLALRAVFVFELLQRPPHAAS